MVYVKFQTKHIRLKRLVSSRKFYTLHEADRQLKSLEQRLSKKNDSLILMLYEQQECFFRSAFELNNDKSSNLLLLLQHLLATEFPEVNEEEKETLFHRVSEAYQNENEESSKTHELSETIEKKKKMVDRNIKNIFQKWIQKFSPMKYFKQQPAKKLVGFFFWKNLSKRKWMKFVGSLCLIGLLSFLFMYFSIAETKENKSYETLVKEESYEQAFEKYPKKEQELVTMLYQKEDERHLKQMATKHDSPLAAFYTYFLNANWEEVVKIEGITQNATVQTMRGYAYLQLNRLEEAELINQEIHSQTLTEQIDRYKKEKAYDALQNQDLKQAEAVNNEIKDKQLTEDIQVAKSMMNLIDKYEQDEKNDKLSDQERKEARENLELWQRNMKQIGEQKNNENDNP